MINYFGLMDPELLRKKIQEKLKEKNLNIAQAEKLAGMSATSLRNFITGRTNNPTLETLRSVAQILDIHITEILTEKTKDSFSKSLKLPWNNKTFLKIATNLSDFLNKTKTPMDSEEAISIVRSIYYLCLENNEKNIDKAFIEWLLKKMTENSESHQFNIKKGNEINE